MEEKDGSYSFKDHVGMITSMSQLKKHNSNCLDIFLASFDSGESQFLLPQLNEKQLNQDCSYQYFKLIKILKKLSEFSLPKRILFSFSKIGLNLYESLPFTNSDKYTFILLGFSK